MEQKGGGRMTEYVKIKCDGCKYREECADYGWQGCRKFTPKPTEPMTNEEWLRSCTTEQLANVFFEYRYANATPQQQLWLSANEDFVKCGIVEWLKQPHTTKE